MGFAGCVVAEYFVEDSIILPCLAEVSVLLDRCRLELGFVAVAKVYLRPFVPYSDMAGSSMAGSLTELHMHLRCFQGCTLQLQRAILLFCPYD